MYAIETTGLSKAFRGIYAVRDLSLKVPEGAIYGFIGENGSGKSTTEKLISGLLVPSRGEIRLYGKPYTDAGVRACMGVLIENPGCFPGSTVYQNLMMQALNLNIKNPRPEVERVLKLVSMVSAANRKFKECSLGMKQRLGVAQRVLQEQAVAHDCLHLPVRNDVLPGGQRRHTEFNRAHDAAHTHRGRCRGRRVRRGFHALLKKTRPGLRFQK